MNNIKKIIIHGCLIEIFFLLIASINPLRKKMGDFSLTLSLSGLFWFTVALLLIIFLIYFYTNRLITNQKEFKTVLIFFLIFNATLVFSWPLTSTDVFSYIGTSRVWSVHHANPYLFAFNNFPNDAFANTINNSWSDLPALYAPLFMFIGGLLTFLGKNSLLLTLYLFKFIFIGINILNCYLLHKVFKNQKATFLYAWNPLILFEFGVNAHNDVLTILFLLLCFLFALKKPNTYKNFSLALFFLWCSVLIKFVTAFLLPILIIVYLKQAKLRKEKFSLLLIFTAVSAMTLLIFYFPFWHNLETFSRIIIHVNHVYSAWIFSSFFILVFSSFFLLLGNINFTFWGAISGKILFLFTYIFLLLKSIRGYKITLEKSLVSYFLASLAIFYLTFFTWFMPWYLTVLILLLLANFSQNNDKKNLWAVYISTLYGIFYYTVLG